MQQSGTLFGEERYEGEYRNGFPHGQGVMTWSNGTRYDGEWLDGLLHGQGVLTWLEVATTREGTRYIGEFRDGNLHGPGVVTKPDGTRYEGNWRYGLPRLRETGDGKQSATD